ncbi:hypothetical protein K4039_08615 [Lyngbya sp. CCAP 1446/10]|uniref:hypothetical protein n=1 Tax=Lyngbya sp. CCAP 1446/10 TaxID=439293 RepID=UPI00223847EA|nr:hypothetical protein [Lyngbya sp. CCAP 1446/10]MCW6050142.1 hypothetical protein [Lyngbya sp. CCAP 1446/10]
MPNPTAVTNQPVEIAIVVEKMAIAVLSFGEWLLKQQQQLKQQQRKLAEKQHHIE